MGIEPLNTGVSIAYAKENKSVPFYSLATFAIILYAVSPNFAARFHDFDSLTSRLSRVSIARTAELFFGDAVVRK